MNSLLELYSCGQSFWYDNIRRLLLLDGTVEALIREDGLRGMTSNPSIFDKAIGSADDYDDQIRELAEAGMAGETLYEELAITDIRVACDLFAELYTSSGGGDGYVSLEVSPHLANDEERTVSEAKRLAAAVGRPNVMIKVPATAAGVGALEQLTAAGININVTLMFSTKHYEAVANAYVRGLKAYHEAGGDLSQVASVASFFVSRVDTAVDKILAEKDELVDRSLMGRAAVSNSKLVYQRYKELFQSREFVALGQVGAKTQRLLWASTSTKNPAYPDTIYVDELIGPHTVNTIPPSTIDAFRDHGSVELTLERDLDGAQQTLDRLIDLGIDLNGVTEQLQQEGLAAFSTSYDHLLDTLELKLRALLAGSA
ncbi:MAG: transaldolase [Chloroflexota bacterium]|nr:MAG: transaldolase [Chloroflexota bacterium]